jgi:hypothetical protein
VQSPEVTPPKGPKILKRRKAAASAAATAAAGAANNSKRQRVGGSSRQREPLDPRVYRALVDDEAEVASDASDCSADNDELAIDAAMHSAADDSFINDGELSYSSAHDSEEEESPALQQQQQHLGDKQQQQRKKRRKLDADVSRDGRSMYRQVCVVQCAARNR